MADSALKLNDEYNKKVDELFEEILCDKCMKTLRMGNVEGTLSNSLNCETLFLCKRCNDEIRIMIKKR